MNFPCGHPRSPSNTYEWMEGHTKRIRCKQCTASYNQRRYVPKEQTVRKLKSFKGCELEKVWR
jgi:hypothetical protein